VQETEVANLEAQREEKRLDAQVRKPADAAAYEKQVQAEAERAARISIAEAEAREVELAAVAKAKQIEQVGSSEARIASQRGIAEAEATKARGEAEGASIRAKGLAEAESIAKRAEALEKEADAVIGQQIAEKLPDIVRAGWVGSSLQARRQPHRAQRRAGDLGDHRAGDRAGRPGAGDGPRRARAHPQRRRRG
jgi:flotillin